MASGCMIVCWLTFSHFLEDYFSLSKHNSSKTTNIFRKILRIIVKRRKSTCSKLFLSVVYKMFGSNINAKTFLIPASQKCFTQQKSFKNV